MLKTILFWAVHSWFYYVPKEDGWFWFQVSTNLTCQPKSFKDKVELEKGILIFHQTLSRAFSQIFPSSINILRKVGRSVNLGKKGLYNLVQPSLEDQKGTHGDGWSRMDSPPAGSSWAGTWGTWSTGSWTCSPRPCRSCTRGPRASTRSAHSRRLARSY